MTDSDRTILERVARHAEARADRVAFRFLASGEGETSRLTFGELVARARALAAVLGAGEPPRARVLLLLDAGLPFIEALFACMFAGSVAIPVGAPRGGRPADRLVGIVRDSGAQAFVTSARESPGLDRLFAAAPELAGLRRYVVDADLAALSAPAAQDIGPDAPAFLQYTSGSTSRPQGVLVTHKNLISNERQIAAAFAHDDETRFVGWLPMFHDMGLVGNVLHPAFLGVECTLMPPAAFIQRPSRWLRAISTYRGTTSGGPNFAFDHCVARIADSELEALDLSCWRVAFNGAEPVRARTLEAFARKFAGCGFSATSFLPCYGLAEATLFVSGRSRFGRAPPATLRVTVAGVERGVLEPALEDAASIELVSSGPPSEGQTIAVTDPQSGRRCGEGEVGEIWVAGPNVADRLDNAAEPDPLSGAAGRTARAGFLATGDLGALWRGELYVVGRIKNLIIVRGRNVHAEDLEQAVSGCHDLLQPNRCAAFAVDAPGDGAAGAEAIVIVQEVKRRPRSAEEAAEAIERAREAVVRYADAAPHEIVLVRPGAIPTTSSGKIRHAEMRAAYLAGQIARIGAQRPIPA